MPVIAITTTSQKVLSEDNSRSSVLVQNQSDVIIKVRLFRDADSEGFDLAPKVGSTPGGSMLLSGDDAKSEVWAIHEDSGNKNLYYNYR